MKKFLLFAAAAALFAACASDELQTQTQQQTAQDDGAIMFDVYTQKAVTRAGWTGEVKSTPLATDATTTPDATKLGYHGFGVFAYYTDNFDYTPLYTPNFMYNEKVYFQSGAFKYDLTKYWPNEHGSAATSADQDRVSFFAYAPYVEVDPSTGMLAESGTLLDASDEKLQWGITGMKRNTLQGDPVIQYIASFDQNKSVDLCWATTGSSDITWSTNNSSQKIVAGYPWLNVRKPDGVVGENAKVRFNFQHATAKLAVTVKTDFTGGWKVTEANKTKVWIRSIRFTGIAQKAALNLNNPKTMGGNKARWIDYYGTNELELGESVTVYDGRKDGSEGVIDAIAPNEAVLGLNPKVVQTEGQIVNNEWLTSGTGIQPGVTNTEVNLFCENLTDPIFVIPTGEKVNVEIVYDIETIDPKLPTLLSDGETYGSTVENRITKAITFGTATSKFENGKSYTINLILGMKDVQFNADVNETWDNGGSADAYLPNNMPSFAAYSTGSNLKLGISGDQNILVFAVTGFESEEGIIVSGAAAPLSGTTSANSAADFAGTANKANTSGIVFVKVDPVTTYTDVVNSSTTNNITVTGANGKKVILDITQYAVKLGLTAPSDKAPKSAGTEYVYTSNATDDNWQIASTDASPVSPYVNVWLNGSLLTKEDGDGTPSASDKFTFSEGNLKLGVATNPGDVIKITIKTGDVAAETVTFTVGS